jgi:hypothetical protein
MQIVVGNYSDGLWAIGAQWDSYPRLVDLILRHNFLTVNIFTIFVKVIPATYIDCYEAVQY